MLCVKVWVKIGNEVTKKRSGNLNTEIFQGMSNSSQFFRNILKPKRSLALFYPSFKIVVPRLQVYKKEKSSTDASKSEEDLDNDLQMKGKAIVSSTKKAITCIDFMRTTMIII